MNADYVDEAKTTLVNLELDNGKGRFKVSLNYGKEKLDEYWDKIIIES